MQVKQMDATLHTEIVRKYQEQAKAKADAEALNTQLNCAMTKLHENAEIITRLQAEVKQLANYKDRLDGMVEIFKTSKDPAHTVLRDEIDNLKMQLSNAAHPVNTDDKQLIKNLMERVNALTLQIHELKIMHPAQIRCLTEKNKDFAYENEHLTAQNKKLTTEKEEWIKKCHDINDNLQNLSKVRAEEAQSANHSYVACYNQLVAKANSYDELDKKYGELRDELENNKNVTTESTLANTEQLQDTIMSHSATIELLNDRIERLESQLEKESSYSKTLSDEKNSQAVRISALQAQNNKLSAAYNFMLPRLEDSTNAEFGNDDVEYFVKFLKQYSLNVRRSVSLYVNSHKELDDLECYVLGCIEAIDPMEIVKLAL